MPGFSQPEGGFRLETVFDRNDTAAPGRTRPEAVLSRLQDAAEAHCNSLGLSRDEAMAHGSFWAVTRTELRFERAVPPERPLVLDTWSGQIKHGLFRRHYRLSDPEGQVLLRGLSVWALMDWEQRVLSRDWAWARLPQCQVEGALPEALRRPPFPPLERAGSRTVADAETDINGHLNNALYLPWGEALLDPLWLERRRLVSLYIEYHRELRRGDTAALLARREENTLFLLGTLREQKAFEMRMEYDLL